MGSKRLFDDVDLEIRAGEKVVLLGESGTGKSTLLKVLLGMQRPDRGLVGLAGLPVTAATISRIRSRICFVPQSVTAEGSTTGLEFLMLPFTFKANRARLPASQTVMNAVDALGLDRALLERGFSSFSGGERQRLALARALLLEREILLLDETTSQVDGANKHRITELLRALPRTTVLAVSHDPEWLERFDSAYRLESGHISHVPLSNHRKTTNGA